MNRYLTVVLMAIAALEFAAPVAAQGEMPPTRCVPMSERGDQQLGCFIIASESLGKLAVAQLFWHLDTFPSRAAAEAARGANGTVVEADGRIWLLTIADADWRPASAERIASVGPLVPGFGELTATYMEAIFMPGMKSSVHRHSGPEAWYVLEGEQCLETPEGKIVAAAGQSAMVRGGPPMQLVGTGTGRRRALVLILHDAAQPPVIPASDWTPKGICGT